MLFTRYTSKRFSQLCLSLLLYTSCQAPQHMVPQPQLSPTQIPTSTPPSNPSNVQPERSAKDYSDSEVRSRELSLSPFSGQLSPDGSKSLMRIINTRNVTFSDGKKAQNLLTSYNLLDLSTGKTQALLIEDDPRAALQAWENNQQIIYARNPQYLSPDFPTILRYDTATNQTSEVFKLSRQDFIQSLEINGESLYILTSKGLQTYHLGTGTAIRSYTPPFPDFYSFIAGFQLLPKTRKALIWSEKSMDKHGQTPFKVQMTTVPIHDYYLLDLVSGEYTAIPELKDISHGLNKPLLSSPDGQHLLLILQDKTNVTDLNGQKISEIPGRFTGWVNADTVVSLQNDSAGAKLELIDIQTNMVTARLALNGTEAELIEVNLAKALIQLKQDGQNRLISVNLSQPSQIPAPKILLSYDSESFVHLINSPNAERSTSQLVLGNFSNYQTLYSWDPASETLSSQLDLKSRVADFKYDPENFSWWMLAQ